MASGARQNTNTLATARFQARVRKSKRTKDLSGSIRTVFPRFSARQMHRADRYGSLLLVKMLGHNGPGRSIAQLYIQVIGSLPMQMVCQPREICRSEEFGGDLGANQPGQKYDSSPPRRRISSVAQWKAPPNRK